MCPECGAEVAHVAAPAHAYVPGAPGCWAAFTTVQGNELSRYGWAPAHGLVVDTYMAQHPGNGEGDQRAQRSPIIHLIGLCGRLEGGLDDHRVNRLLQGAAQHLRSANIAALAPRTEPGSQTILNLLTPLESDVGVEEYGVLAQRWAKAVWRTWSHEHDRIRKLFELVYALEEVGLPR